MVAESSSKWSPKVAASGRESTQSTLSGNHECADKAKFAKLWVNRKTLLDEKRQKTVQCAVMSMTKDGDTDGYTAPEMSWKLISIHPGIYWNLILLLLYEP